MAEIPKKYNFSRELLVKMTIFFSRKITAFALLEEQIDLQGYCFLPSELLLDDDLLKKCDLIIGQAQKFLRDLGEYDIDENLITSYRELIDEFKTLVNNNELMITAKTDT